MSDVTIQEPPGSTAPSRPEPRHLRNATILWAVLSIVGIAVWLSVAQFVLPPAANGLDISDNFSIVLFTILSIPVALFVWVFLGYSLFAFRIKAPAEGPPIEAGVPLQPTTGIQLGWLGITSVLCLFMVVWGMFGFYQETATNSPQALVVKITAQQWLWNFDYPQYGISSQSQELELPVGRPIQFQVTSLDVLHGFSIRAMGIRVDANPGEITTPPQVIPNQIGHYSVACVELCGLYHSYMWSDVNVVSISDFNTWVVNQGGKL
jgi:cytochrome c oxidase subunit 2